MKLQELNEEYLWLLKDRLDYELSHRFMICESCDDEMNPWCQPMYLIPYWNIIQKIIAFTSYFDELNVPFPFEEVYRQPIELSTVFPDSLIHSKEEELIFRGEIIKITYKYVA